MQMIFFLLYRFIMEDLFHLNVVGTGRVERAGGIHKKGGNLYSWWADESGALCSALFIVGNFSLNFYFCHGHVALSHKKRWTQQKDQLLHIYEKLFISHFGYNEKSYHVASINLLSSHQCSKIILPRCPWSISAYLWMKIDIDPKNREKVDSPLSNNRCCTPIARIVVGTQQLPIDSKLYFNEKCSFN